MAEVVDNATGRMSDEDLKADLAYLRTLPPIRNRIECKSPNSWVWGRETPREAAG